MYAYAAYDLEQQSQALEEGEEIELRRRGTMKRCA